MTNNLNDPVKILARRFASLPASVRLKIAERLLRWREDHQASNTVEDHSVSSCAPKTSLLEQFWDEVERAHDDGLYPTNPFADQRPQPVLCVLQENHAQHPAYILN